MSDMKQPVVLFQFPPNGKAYPKSIGRDCHRQTSRQFQFPPNGKAYPKPKGTRLTDFRDYKFQFPPNGKAYPKDTEYAIELQFLKEFQFPPNGKAYPKYKKQEEINPQPKFQFPPNGKAYPKMAIVVMILAPLYPSFNSLRTGKHIQRPRKLKVLGDAHELVSIPSERESISKVKPEESTAPEEPAGFNSLRTGKHIQSQMDSSAAPPSNTGVFQFPPNGKAYPKLASVNA